MKTRWIKFLVTGIIIVIFLIFLGIGAYNIVIYQIPIFEQKINTTPYEMNHNNPIQNISQIAADDPVRENLLAEEKAWEYSWVFLQNNDNFKIFLPIKKDPIGLLRITDKKENTYLAWVFGVEQPRVPLLQGHSRGGIIFIDARDGCVLWYDPFL